MDNDQRMRRIRETICSIPDGTVASYGQIAELAGIPRGARQVAYTLRHLPDGHNVPWHRVVRTTGRIAFAANSAKFDEQCQRLMMESVVVTAGRIDMGRFRWQPDLDELLWKPTDAWDDL